MTGEHITLLLGAYVLDALDAHERAAADRHLARCPACTAELRQLQPLPALLSRLTLDDVTALDQAAAVDAAAPAVPSPDLFARIAAAVAPPSRERRLSLRTGLLAAAAVVVLAAAGAGAAGWAGSEGHPSSSYSATAGRVQFRVALTSAAVGTAIHVRVAGVPYDEHCTLVVVARDGTRHRAGRWVAGYSGSADLTTATDVTMDQVRQLVLLGTDGRQLVTVRV